MLQSRRVDRHEGHESAEVQNLDGSLPAKRQSSDISEKSDDHYVISRVATPRIKISERFLRQNVVATHAVEQANRSQMPRKSAGQARHQQHDAKAGKQPIASDNLSDVHECRFRVRKRAIVGPHSLREIDLEPREESGK